MIGGVAEAEDGDENESQKQHADGETDAFSEGFSQLDHEDDSNDNVDQRDEKKDDPPARFSDDLANDVDVIDGDDAGPAWLAGFDEDFPHSGDDEDAQNKRDQPAGGAAGVLRGVRKIWRLSEERAGGE